jgi:uncharacterized heparinase superfamily protein
MLPQFGLMARTLPYLRWQQLVYRPVRLLQYRSYRSLPLLARRWRKPLPPIPSPSTDTLSLFRHCIEAHLSHWHMPAQVREERLYRIKCGQFNFLNQLLEIRDPDWNVRYVSHLWNYQLHYHDYIFGLMQAWAQNADSTARQRAIELIDGWIATTRIGLSDGWDAYPLSLRVVNWIFAYALAVEREIDQAFLARWRTSIFRQLDFLCCHLEKHLLANHLLKNVKALVIGGLFFAHTEKGQRWLEAGECELERQLNEQVLPDGGHYERAPMYHAQALGDLLECYALLKAAGRQSATANMRASLIKMGQYLASLSYADGSLALFNDSANTLEIQPARLLDAIHKVCQEKADDSVNNFLDSGYYIWQSADRSEKIVIDAGEPAAAYNTAHAHCDMLSYELRLKGLPFVVDSGVHGYGGDLFREYSRSTRAHNTVMVEGVEQSEVWSTFRVARRAKVLVAKALENTEGWHFCGEVQGYGKNGLCHARNLRRFPNGEWEVTDRLLLSNARGKEQVATSFIHLHPAVNVRQQGSIFLCETQQGQIGITPFGDVALELVRGVLPPQAQGWWFPTFGVAMPSFVIVMRCRLRKGADGQLIGYRIKPCL